MKKLKLRKEVKEVLIVGAVIVISIIALNNNYKKAVESCVNYGHTQEYCEVIAK